MEHSLGEIRYWREVKGENWFKIKFFFHNWKIGAHFIFQTKRFGVNNRWWCKFDSLFGVSIWKKLYRILTVKRLIYNYGHMKHRAIYFGFLDHDTCRKLGWIRNKKNVYNMSRTQNV